MTQGIDFQAQSISDGLQNLQTLLENPVATSSLELGKNAAAATEYEVLKKLHKSLLQYVQRNATLFYIGILGHFSAGKSSTINSVLETWNTAKERKTDLHPTDTTITLITREKNASSLLGVIREGHVIIRLEQVESPLLNEIVLVDTPGTGDPQFIEEAARDFLPICDLILFLFSAASPLDKSDVPLLTELHKRLPFIPIHFVVTRADELRSDANAPLTEANLDARKTETFLSTAVGRVNTLLAPQAYVPSSFSLIDNRSGFRIDQLREFLRLRCDSSNPQAHVSMHLNKLHFYRSSAKYLRDFFSGILSKKLNEISRIVEAAEKNIDKYQQLVQISNSNLTKTWMEHVAAINAAAATALDIIRPLDSLPQSYTAFRSVTSKRIDLVGHCSRSAKFHAGGISSKLSAQVAGKLQEHLYSVQSKIASTPLQELGADVHARFAAPEIDPPSLTEMQAPASLYHQGVELREAEAEALRDAATQIRRGLSTLHEQASQRAPFKLAAESIESASQSLKIDLGQFFQNVELYRSGVFSHTTKESIATLGIGAELDALEVEFTDADREEFARSASDELFPGSQDLIAVSTAGTLNLLHRAQEIVEEARPIRVEKPEENLAVVQEAVLSDTQALRSDLQTAIQSEVERFCGGLSVTLSNLIVEAKSKGDSELNVLHRARIWRYSSAFVITAAFSSIGIVAYHHFGAPAPASFIGQAAFNLTIGLLVELVVLGIVKARENAPRMISHTREKTHVKLQEDVKQAVDAQLKALALNSLNEHILSGKISKIYQRPLDFPSPDWQTRAKNTLEMMRQLSVMYTDLRGAYGAIVEKVRQDAQQYFVDSSRNLAVLNQVAAGIRSKAIQPSFELLATTREKLSLVKIDVDAIAFD